MALGLQPSLPVRRKQMLASILGQKQQQQSKVATYPHRTGTSELAFETTLKLARIRLNIRVCHLDADQYTQKGNNECAEHDGTLARSRPCVLVGREHAVEVEVLVDRLAKVPPLLLVPPVSVGVAELTLDRERVDISAVLG